MPSYDLRLSAVMEAQLDRSVRQVDRLDGPGAGAATILDVVGDGPGLDPLLVDLFCFSVPGKPKLKDAAPRTLGAIAVAMKHWARRRSVAGRRGHRGKTPPDPKALAAWREAHRE